MTRKTELPVAEKLKAKQKAWRLKDDSPSTTHTYYRGDARSMAQLKPNQAVDLVITSPPYWTLKEYASDADGNQLGHIEDYNQFLGQLDLVWKRCFRLLTPGGRLCIVVGDVCLSRRKSGRHHVVPLHADISIRCRKIGFDYLSPIYWHKITNVATEVSGNGAAFLGKPYEPNAIIKNNVEYILMLRKPSDYRHPSQKQRDLSMIDKADHEQWFRQLWDDIPGASQNGHPAPFPEELAFRLISMFSFVDDTVLDPFAGTGNTIAAALRAHRSSIGFEIEKTYCDLARRKLQSKFGDLVRFEVDDARTK